MIGPGGPVTSDDGSSYATPEEWASLDLVYETALLSWRFNQRGHDLPHPQLAVIVPRQTPARHHERIVDGFRPGLCWKLR